MNGILALDKPSDISSFLACSIVRRLLGAAKAGHGGTLDPMATGVLPILLGSATRAMDLIPAQDKRYEATLRFGFVSDTLDACGKVTATGKPAPTRAALEAALAAFRGDILQVPPMTSALQKDGVRLYELARRGIVVDRPARPVTVYALDLIAFAGDAATIAVHCSKGFYVRSLCDDVGRALGCGAVMTALRRTEAAGIPLARCVTLNEAKALAAGTLAERVLPTDTLFAAYPAVTVTAAQAVRFSNGGALALDRLKTVPAGVARVYGDTGVFLGLGCPKDGELRITRLFC